MNLSPLLAASPAIQLHVAAATIAIMVTPVQLLLERGSPSHRMIGRVWMIAMATTALSSFFISTIRWFGPFSPLHLLSVIALVSLVSAYRAARRGDVRSHAWTLVSLVLLALIGAGTFTLLPGRIMHDVIFTP